ncbi:MAG TPA: hypothetical protein VJT50_04640 [Pyrinomonadaceae bacterium]|nr:hypothetical protein [Pyrinomonadaceae bacterium]
MTTNLLFARTATFLKMVLIFAALAVLFGSGVIASADKMTPDEVIAKHLAAIGPAETLAGVKTRLVSGNVNARFRLTNTRVEVSGPAVLASDGNKVVLGMGFNANNYPFEKAAFDGEKVTVGILPSGGRSRLADFLIAQELVMKHGLLGGELSSAWPLYNPIAKDVKLTYAGTDKINGRQVHKLKYTPKNAGNLQTTLYFDAETFQHVRSQYEYAIPARQGSDPTLSAAQRESRFKLIEEFSDFKPVDKLTLPHKYHLELILETQDRTQTMEYDIDFADYSFNQVIAPTEFNVSKNG